MQINLRDWKKVNKSTNLRCYKQFCKQIHHVNFFRLKGFVIIIGGNNIKNALQSQSLV